MMTMKRLEQYRALRREIEHDEERISALGEMRQAVCRYGNRIQTNRHADSVADYVEYLEQISQYLYQNKTRCADGASLHFGFYQSNPGQPIARNF